MPHESKKPDEKTKNIEESILKVQKGMLKRARTFGKLKKAEISLMRSMIMNLQNKIKRFNKPKTLDRGRGRGRDASFRKA